MIRRHLLAGLVGFKALLAGTALLGSVGQADAASVRYDLRYIDTVLDDAHVFSTETGDTLWDSSYGPLSIHDSPWRVTEPYALPEKGSLTEAYASFEYLDNEWDPGYIAPVCYVGSFNCEVFGGDRYVAPGSFNITSDAFRVWQEGLFIYALTWGEYHLDGFHIRGDGYEGSAISMTSTYEIIELAPVPLPPTAAILPMGLGALAMMRRRRKA